MKAGSSKRAWSNDVGVGDVSGRGEKHKRNTTKSSGDEAGTQPAVANGSDDEYEDIAQPSPKPARKRARGTASDEDAGTDSTRVHHRMETGSEQAEEDDAAVEEAMQRKVAMNSALSDLDVRHTVPSYSAPPLPSPRPILAAPEADRFLIIQGSHLKLIQTIFH